MPSVRSVSRLLLRVADAYAPSVEVSERHLAIQVADDVEIWGDPDLLAQVFANLIEGIPRHPPIGTRIVLTLSTTSGAAMVRLDDDGPGIPEAERQKVIQRLDRSRGSVGNGLGVA